MKVFSPTHRIKADELYIGCLGDTQYTGPSGATAQNHLKDFISDVKELKGYFLGFGDYCDILSPSNRQKLIGAGFYDNAKDFFDSAASELMTEFYETFLKGTENKWMGLLKGHHYYQFQDSTTTDAWLASKLNSPFSQEDASMLVRVIYGKNLDREVKIFCHHGTGSGVLPTAGLNKLYHIASTLNADVFAMGHNTKLANTSTARMDPSWDKDDNFELTHKEIRLVNTGGFAKSYGGYAEEQLLGAAPLGAPILWLRKDGCVKVIS